MNYYLKNYAKFLLIVILKEVVRVALLEIKPDKHLIDCVC